MARENLERNENPPLDKGGLAQQDAEWQDTDLQAVQEIHQAREQIMTQIRKRIVGQDKVIEHLLIALFSRGHSLLMGVPGLAKTLLISTLSELLALCFNRIQFTPDLMPSDITGTDILQEEQSTGRRQLQFLQGPIFCNILLADEINRTPPKTQAALLQSMQEYKVSAGGRTYPLDLPFLVFATQNPIEQEGTYPLPEAQLDRFMFMIEVGYPSLEEEEKIVRNTTSSGTPLLEKVLGPERIIALQELVLRVPVPPHLIRRAVQLVRQTRPAKEAPQMVQEYLSWGAGPRASQYLILAAKARAVLHGRYAVQEEDVETLAYPVLAHRLITNFHAEASGITTRQIIEHLLEKTVG